MASELLPFARLFDIGGTAYILTHNDMPAQPAHSFSYAMLGDCYSISRQRAFQLVEELGWDVVTVADSLFRALLDKPASRLRARLADPQTRRTVQGYLNSAAFRDAVKPPPIRKTKAQLSTTTTI